MLCPALLISISYFICDYELRQPVRVVTARTGMLLVILSGSFTSPSETGPTLTVPKCWKPGFNTKYCASHV